MKLLSRLTIPCLIILLTVFAILPLLNPYFYPMHDDEQIARLFDLDQSIKSGHFPPRIVPNLGFGYGYPFFNYYPPFAYYVGEVYHLIGFGYILSTKLMLITGFFLSAFFMYLFTKEFFGRLAGLVSAVSYTYISYRAVDVYVRGSYAEFFAFVFIPLMFWSVYKLAKTNNIKFVILGSLGTAGLILSHNLVAFMSSIFMGIWLLYGIYVSKEKIRFTEYSILLFMLGFGLSAYFFLPSYFERGYTIVNILTTELADYKLHFVCVYQLWDSMWGYGGSILGCYDGISFEIGKVHLVIAAIVFLLSAWFFIKKQKIKKIIPILIFSAMLFISIFLMVNHSRPIWDTVQALWYVQFPWRFLIFSGFSASFLTGSFIYFVKGRHLRYLAGFVIVFVIIISNISRFTPQRFINVQDQDYVSPEKLRWETSSLAYEYVPTGIAVIKSQIGTTRVDIKKEEIASSSSQVISGTVDIQEVTNKPHYKKFRAMVFEPGVLQINTYSFPGWEVFVDGVKTDYSNNNKLKLIRINLSGGEHLVEAKLFDTPVRRVGNTISIVSIILFAALMIFSIKTKKNHA
jgi:hypothetical protein